MTQLLTMTTTQKFPPQAGEEEKGEKEGKESKEEGSEEKAEEIPPVGLIELVNSYRLSVAFACFIKIQPLNCLIDSEEIYYQLHYH